MANNFDWQTEDNFDWDQLTAEDSDLPSPPKRRRWPYIIVILLLLGGTVFMIWRQVEQRVDSNIEAMRADIISSHNLINFAEAEQDIELFVSLLSGRDSNWTQAQNQLFSNDLLLDRAPFGLHALTADDQPGVDDADNIAVEFSPDLIAAELLQLQPYAVAVGNGVTETVHLQQSNIYRQGRERWLLSPPETDYWGEPIVLSNGNFTLTYPERDAEVGERLVEDLGRKVGEACQTLGLGICPNDYLVNLDLSDDPETLINTKEIVPVQSNGRTLNLTLPAPSLVGIPVDEAGYQALFRGYGGQVVTAVTTHFLNYTCCEHAPLYRAMLDYQLDLLSLKPWPVNEQTYQRVLEKKISFDHLIINDNDLDWADATWENAWPTYVTLDFLLQNDPNLTIAQMQIALDQTSNLRRWLELLQGEPSPERGTAIKEFDQQLWLYAYEYGLQISDSPPDKLPEQALFLLCTSNKESFQSTLYRYQPQQDTWTTEYTTEQIISLNVHSSGNTLVLSEFDRDLEQWRLTLWKNNQSTPIFDDPPLQAFSLGQIDPQGQLLTAYIYGEDDQTATINVFDLIQCDDNGCSRQLLPGIPVWSPDGEQALFAEDLNSQVGIITLQNRVLFRLFNPRGNNSDKQALFRADRNDLLAKPPISELAELENIGQGFAPFWIDAQTYGYLQDGENRSQTKLQLVSNNDTPTTVLETSHLEAALPDKFSQDEIIMLYVLPHPTNSQLLFITAFDYDQNIVHIFNYDRESEETTWLMHTDTNKDDRGPQHELSVNSNGRYLHLFNYPNFNSNNAQEPFTISQIYDTQNHQTIPFKLFSQSFFPSTNWSQDGQWMALMLADDQLALYAPEQKYLHTIPLDFGNCSSPGWIN